MTKFIWRFGTICTTNRTFVC